MYGRYTQLPLLPFPLSEWLPWFVSGAKLKRNDLAIITVKGNVRAQPVLRLIVATNSPLRAFVEILLRAAIMAAYGSVA